MHRRPRTPFILGFLAILGGLLLLAYTQVSVVLPDVSRADPKNLREGQVASEVTGVVVSALLVTLGTISVLANASRAPWLPKSLALALVALVLPLFLIVQTTLVVNGASARLGDDRYVYFSASYLFHSGDEWSFAAVYVLFFFNLALVFLLLGAIGYLLAPQRFRRAVLDRFSWAKNEAIHVAATLFLLLSIGVLFYYLLRLAVETRAADVRALGLFGHMLVPGYFLLCLLLLALGLTVAAHAFLLNWGTQAPVELHRLLENIRTIARVERTLLLSAAALNLFILFGPTLPSQLSLSGSFAFALNPRGLGYAFYLLLLPYAPYAVTQRRLEALLRAGRAPATGAPFAERSLRLVLVHAAGLVLLTVAAATARWDPLLLMMSYSGWTTGVLLVQAVRVEAPRGLPRLAFRGESGPAFYFVFLGMSVSTGLMLWGAGNTYEVTASFLPRINNLDVDNASGYGADVFARLAAATLLAATLILTVDLWLDAYRVPRRFLGHYIAIFLSSTLSLLLVFTVSVWTAGEAGLENAYTGFAFHQYYDAEQWGAGLLLSGTAVYIFLALGRILRPIVDREPAAPRTAVVRSRTA